MSKNTNTTTISKILGIGIAVIQLLDIIIHAATDQLEMIRVSSNVIIFLWLAAMASGRFNTKFPAIAVSSIGSYLILNIIFLIREGVTNVEQGGELRVVLLLLMFLTTTLSTLLTYTYKNRLLN
ncbi:MAG: hypothetical protein HZB50_16340 [Chloroflexi bacterium]|nr:hypothetical protein [Chloroflexota bacterium]